MSNGPNVQTFKLLPLHKEFTNFRTRSSSQLFRRSDRVRLASSQRAGFACFQSDTCKIGYRLPARRSTVPHLGLLSDRPLQSTTINDQSLPQASPRPGCRRMHQRLLCMCAHTVPPTHRRRHHRPRKPGGISSLVWRPCLTRVPRRRGRRPEASAQIEK
jgi:hypothetical protein